MEHAFQRLRWVRLRRSRHPSSSVFHRRSPRPRRFASRSSGSCSNSRHRERRGSTHELRYGVSRVSPSRYSAPGRLAGHHRTHDAHRGGSIRTRCALGHLDARRPAQLWHAAAPELLRGARAGNAGSADIVARRGCQDVLRTGVCSGGGAARSGDLTCSIPRSRR